MTTEPTKLVNNLEEIITDLVEWELASMDFQSLQDYYYEAKVEYYHNNPDGLKDMLQYKKELTDTEIVFQWDVQKNDN